MARTTVAAERLLAAAGPTVSIETVAKCYGIHRTTGYELARRGELGVPVLRLGRRLRVPTAELRRVLGIEQPQQQAPSGGRPDGGGAAA